MQVALGISVHAVFLCQTISGAAAVLGVVLLAWFIIRQIPARVFWFWLAAEAVLIAIFSLAAWLGRDTPEYAFRTLLNWSAGLTGGVLVVLWPGVENLAKVIIRLPLPYYLTRSFGFALRSIPVLGAEIANHARNLRTLDLIGARTPSKQRVTLGVSEILAQAIDGIDKIITQIETRGFDPTMFGSLPPLGMQRGNIVALVACCVAIIAPLILRLL
ncbi:MAG TPA: hypothetical protein VN493_18225 [Thermoanaerobaculia bacterium]|nr:hypothetical protein [Thermoanaerobaculia bacterium]